jgi:salicylate hydroxylase
MRIVVIGAGVAGCIMVRALARLSGAEVFCLERAESEDQSESGTGLNIGPNGVQALSRHDPTLIYRILRTATAPHIAYRCTITWIGACQTDSSKTA